MYDYCVDDPIGKIDPSGLWTKSSFNESRVSRDTWGQFSSSASNNTTTDSQKLTFAPEGSIFNTVDDVINNRKKMIDFKSEAVQSKKIHQPMDNIYERELGVYKGPKLGIYKADPIIFDQESEAPNPLVYGVAGSTTENKGPFGTFFTEAYAQGKLRLVVYGDPATKKATSWSLYEWVDTGKKHPETNTTLFEWDMVSSPKHLERRPLFYGLKNKFLNNNDKQLKQNTLTH